MVSGELDVNTSPKLLSAVQDALGSPGCRDVVVDLSTVSFADAAAMGTLVLAHLACRHVGGRLTVFGAHGRVAEVMALTGVDAILGRTGAGAEIVYGQARDRFSRWSAVPPGG